MKLRRFFCVALFGLSLTMPMGCDGGANQEATDENDPVMADPENDPALDDENTEVNP